VNVARVQVHVCNDSGYLIVGSMLFIFGVLPASMFMTSPVIDVYPVGLASQGLDPLLIK
jgi:hypothetical protein